MEANWGHVHVIVELSTHTAVGGGLHPAEPQPTNVRMDCIRNSGADVLRLLPRTLGCILCILTLVSGVAQRILQRVWPRGHSDPLTVVLRTCEAPNNLCTVPVMR